MGLCEAVGQWLREAVEVGAHGPQESPVSLQGFTQELGQFTGIKTLKWCQGVTAEWRPLVPVPRASGAGAGGEGEPSGTAGESPAFALCCPAWALAKALSHFL